MKQNFFRFIADLRFTITVLLLISLSSIIGTIIEQDQSIEIYKMNYPLSNPLFNILTWDKILIFGFDHTYKTWWFICLIGLFGVSLITCTFLQQLPSLKIARRCQFFRNITQFNNLNFSTILIKAKFTKILYQLRKKKYSLFHQKNIIYCYKGLIGQIAPIAVHCSMIFILIGTIIASIYGFKAQEIIPKTEIGYIQNIFGNGQLTYIPNIFVRVNDFWITYTKQKTISQFYSDISILNNYGNEIKRQTSFVNSPLIYKKVYYYQTDWDLIGLRITNTKNQIVEYPLIQPSINKNKIWLTYIPNTKQQSFGIIMILDNMQGYFSIYDGNGLFLGNVELNERVTYLFGFNFLEILNSTGLQIKNDPGIPLIYSGSLLLMLSTLVSYISYSQIWIIQQNKNIFLGGNTSRASYGFELEFIELIR